MTEGLGEAPGDLLGCTAVDAQGEKVVVGAAECLHSSPTRQFFVESAFVPWGRGELRMAGAPSLAHIMREQIAIATSVLTYLDRFTPTLSSIRGEGHGGEDLLAALCSVVKGSRSGNLSSQCGFDLHVNFSPSNPGNEHLATLAVLISLVALVTGKQPALHVAFLSDFNLNADLWGKIPDGCGLLENCVGQGINQLVVSQVGLCDSHRCPLSSLF